MPGSHRCAGDGAAQWQHDCFFFRGRRHDEHSCGGCDSTGGGRHHVRPAVDRSRALHRIRGEHGQRLVRQHCHGRDCGRALVDAGRSRSIAGGAQRAGARRDARRPSRHPSRRLHPHARQPRVRPPLCTPRRRRRGRRANRARHRPADRLLGGRESAPHHRLPVHGHRLAPRSRGPGRRELSLATKITVDRTGKTIELENWGTQPVQLRSVRRDSSR